MNRSAHNAPQADAIRASVRHIVGKLRDCGRVRALDQLKLEEVRGAVAADLGVDQETATHGTFTDTIMSEIQAIWGKAGTTAATPAPGSAVFAPRLSCLSPPASRAWPRA